MKALMRPQMADLSPEDQAKKAISHVLQRIRDDRHIGWYMGVGTQAFSLLTEAAASLYDEPIEKVWDFFMPRNAQDPTQEEEES